MPYKDKKQQAEYQRIRLAKKRAEFFKDKTCVKCGGDQNLELNHVDPAHKVTHNIWSWSEVRRQAELDKCQVLCQSCHLAKTLEQRPKTEHGKVQMYRTYGCRCDLCVAAKKESYTRYK